MESTNQQRKDMTIEDLQKLNLKIFSHPHLKEPCFELGMEQKEQLKTCPNSKFIHEYKTKIQIDSLGIRKDVDEVENEKVEIINQQQMDMQNTVGTIGQESKKNENIYTLKEETNK